MVIVALAVFAPWRPSGLVSDAWLLIASFARLSPAALAASYVPTADFWYRPLTYTGYWDAFGVDGPYGDYHNGIGPDPTLGCEDQTIPGCDKGANRYALSFGLKYNYNLNTTFKLEYRRDGADLPVFYDVKSGGYRKTNDLFGASVLLFF